MILAVIIPHVDTEHAIYIHVNTLERSDSEYVEYFITYSNREYGATGGAVL